MGKRIKCRYPENCRCGGEDAKAPRGRKLLTKAGKAVATALIFVMVAHAYTWAVAEMTRHPQQAANARRAPLQHGAQGARPIPASGPRVGLGKRS